MIMLFDLWESFLLISEGIHGGSFTFVLVTLLITLLTYLSWRSTYIPDLPPVPRPPYIIQISAVTENTGPRQSIADVQLVSGANFLRPQLDNPNNNFNNRRRPGGGRTFSNAIRAQISSSNVVVYHRVNVYHHHHHIGSNQRPQSSTDPQPPEEIGNESVNEEQVDPNIANVPTQVLTNNENSQESSSDIHTGTQLEPQPASTSNMATTELNKDAPAELPAASQQIRFTIKFLNDTQMDVTSQLSENIGDFKRRHFTTEMSENKTVRLIFNGRVLDNDTKTLGDFGIFDQCVIHCLIVNTNRQQNESEGRTDQVARVARRVVRLPEPGMFFVAFIGIFLTFLWFICLHFGQHLFTQSAVVSLTILTVIFIIGFVTCYLPLPTN